MAQAAMEAGQAAAVHGGRSLGHRRAVDFNQVSQNLSGSWLRPGAPRATGSGEVKKGSPETAAWPALSTRPSSTFVGRTGSGCAVSRIARFLTENPCPHSP